MKVSLHVGPHRTGTTYIQYAAFQNRAYLADKGIQFINQPAQSNKLAQALVDERADIALAEFDQLTQGCAREFSAAHPAPAILYSSQTFFTDDPRRAARYQTSFSYFVAELEKRGHEVELVFVERDMEDLLTSYALLQTSLGNLKFVTLDLSPYLAYIEGFTSTKLFYFDNFKVAHLSFRHLIACGDLFANFMALAFGLDLPGLTAINPALDARNSVSDAQIAKGLIMAPVVNWLDQFGSVSRVELFNASEPLQTQVQGPSWDRVVESITLLRDCVRGMARRTVETFVGNGEALPT